MATGTTMHSSSFFTSNSNEDLYTYLCENTSTDESVKNDLKNIMLKSVLKLKEQERSDSTFSRKCVYCYDIIDGGLHNLFSHLNFKHSFTFGNPNNIIFGAKLLDIIEQKFLSLQCLYCNKQFPHHEVLRVHMRKKNHRCINPNDRFFDRFYLINYLQPGTPWQQAKTAEFDDCFAPGGRDDFDSTEDWADWKDESGKKTTCLFCTYIASEVSIDLLAHMKTCHKFDMSAVMRDFSFYDKVKAVNFIRSKIKVKQCPACSTQYQTYGSLQNHLRNKTHCRLPTPKLWCSSEFLQPVLPEDDLLCHLDNLSDSEGQCQSDNEVEECPVYSDDPPRSSLSPEVVREISNDFSFSQTSVKCLFCSKLQYGRDCFNDIMQHMRDIHGFNWFDIMKSLSLSKRLQLINYIRWSVAQNCCYCCGYKCEDMPSLEEHRINAGHTELPDEHLFAGDDEFKTAFLKNDELLNYFRYHREGN